MYSQFFGLKQEPFSIAPDPRYLFMSERHREALAHLLYGVDSGGGFVLLTGEIGTGKTTICRCFLEQIPANCNLAYIFNPKLTVTELLQSVCDEFGIAHPQRAPGLETAKDCIDPLNAFLLSAHAAGRNNVLIIDEAQNLSGNLLEQLRLLTNLETNERKLLQIILIGQPELRTMVAHPLLKQLAQRVIARFHLEALSAGETAQYISHRLAVAGQQGANPFDRKALQRLYHHTQGIPRLINLLCGRALLGAYALGQRVVTGAVVNQAAKEVFGPRKTTGSQRKLAVPLWAVMACIGMAAAGLTGLGVVQWMRGKSPSAGLPVATKRVAAPAPFAPPTSSATNAPGTLAAPSQPAQATAQAVEATSVVALSTAVPASSAVAPANVLPTAAKALENYGLLLQDEDDALRALAAQWPTGATSTSAATAPLSVSTTADYGNPCKALQRQSLQCFRSTRANLNLIRQLDRPGILTLYDDNGKTRYGLLAGLGAQNAALLVGGTRYTVPLTMLAESWRGEFVTLWRAPKGYRSSTGDDARNAVQAWLVGPLASVQGVPLPATGAPTDAWLKNNLARFQLAQGLTPDGLPGPVTLMQLNRATGVDEPRLYAGR